MNAYKGGTFASLLKVTLRLIIWEIDEETEVKSIKHIKEQDVYLGDMPLMTDKGTFVFNGTTRVVVSQMHRSPGVFDHDKGKSHSTGKFLFASRLIPYNGSWIDFEFDAKDLIYVRIDKRRKILASTLLLALDNKNSEEYRKNNEGSEIDQNKLTGYSHEDLFNFFYSVRSFSKIKNGWKFKFKKEDFIGSKLNFDLINSEDGKVFAEKGSKFNIVMAKEVEKKGFKEAFISNEDIKGSFLAEDIFNKESGIIYFEAGAEIDDEIIDFLNNEKIEELKILDINNDKQGSYVRDTFFADKNKNRVDALFEIYKVMRPGEPPTVESADDLFRNLFFKRDRYDLSAVGRLKINSRLKHSDNLENRVLEPNDILHIVKYLSELKDGYGEIDDIDHLGNRRVRSVGELLENQYTIGVIRMERAIKERMSNAEIEIVMPNDLVNPKPASASVREFFGQSQLSQFMDQTNPLSEITHKRRLSALGPGGLSRERSWF